jgi:hypothetical protein
LADALKAELVENLLHRDFVAEFVEVDTGHVSVLIETKGPF